MLRYESGLLNKLFLSFGEATIHIKKYGIDDFKYPTIGINKLDKIINKYIDLISDGVIRDFILIEMEKDKIAFLNEAGIEVLCLLIVQKSIFYVMNGDLEYIMELSQGYTNHDVYDELIKLTHGH